jgi:hypothetical protein
MEVDKLPNKRSIRERFLYKGHVVRSGQIVVASDRYFRVVRVWGHHITLEPLSSTEVPKPMLATPISIQPEARRS